MIWRNISIRKENDSATKRRNVKNVTQSRTQNENNDKLDRKLLKSVPFLVNF